MFPPPHTPLPCLVPCFRARRRFVEALGAVGGSPILDETVKNTGNFSWIVANFDHEASATYFIHIFPVLDAATVCTEAGNSVNFATTEPFSLEAQLVTWAWPLPEGVAIEPGKTHTIHIENVINHARRWYGRLDIVLTVFRIHHYFYPPPRRNNQPPAQKDPKENTHLKRQHLPC